MMLALQNTLVSDGLQNQRLAQPISDDREFLDSCRPKKIDPIRWKMQGVWQVDPQKKECEKTLQDRKVVPQDPMDQCEKEFRDALKFLYSRQFITEEEKENNEQLYSVMQQHDSDVYAQAYIQGCRLLNGEGVEQNIKEGIRLIQQAAENHCLKAQNKLGDIYFLDKFAMKDERLARQWYEQAAEGGDAEAQYNLAKMLIAGQGGDVDEGQAFRWCHSAANQGHARAQYKLGRIYEKGGVVLPKHRRKILEEIFRLYMKSAAYGNDSTAQKELAMFYLNGWEDLQKNEKEARYWFQKAAESGDAEGQCNYGWMLHTGIGGAVDFKEAVKWYQSAANQGFARALYNIGTLHRNGQFFAKNDKEAARLYEEAAKKGYVKAQHSLGNLYQKGRGVEVNQEAAITWYERAISQGCQKSQQALDKLRKKMASSRVS